MFTDSRENPCSWRWNPPRHQEFAAELSFVPDDVQSATECTGLMQTVPDTQGAADAMAGRCPFFPSSRRAIRARITRTTIRRKSGFTENKTPDSFRKTRQKAAAFFF